MTDRRRASDQQGRPSEDENPFAPPPEGAPDRVWSPRDGDGHGPGGDDGEKDDQGEPDEQRSGWGGQWSKRQPKRQSGGFGERRGPTDDNGRDTKGVGPRWDPSDPRQRHARYAVLAGMWGVFAGLLGWEWLGLPLGALALYWGIDALRGGKSGKKPEDKPDERPAPAKAAPAAGPPAPGPAGRNAARTSRMAAIAGVVLASVALVIVATTYTVQMVYKDYFDCRTDSLTLPSREACDDLLPSQLKSVLGDPD